MKFSDNKKCFEIGDKIFPFDLSGFDWKTDEWHLNSTKKDEVKEQLRNGIPLIVMSEPHKKSCDSGWFVEEYFIDVKFVDSDEVYEILNSSTNVFKSYYSYLEFTEDCEECAAFGY